MWSVVFISIFLCNAFGSRGLHGWFWKIGDRVIRIGGLAGFCNDVGTISSVDFAIRANRILKFLKPGNTNGSAAVGVVANCLSSADNAIAVSKYRVLSSPVRTGSGVNCLPRVPPLCVSVAIGGCLRFVFSLGGIGLPGGRRVSRIVHLAGVARRTSEVVGRLSGNCHRHMNLTRTLLNGPPMVVLSRPAMNLSPGRVVRVEGLVHGLNGGRAMVFSSRILSRISRIYSEVIIVSGNGVITSTGASRLSTRMSNNRGLSLATRKDATSVARTVGGVPTIGHIAGANDGTSNDKGCVVRCRASDSVEESICGTVMEINTMVLSVRSNGRALRSVFLGLASNGCSDEGRSVW